MVSGLPIQSSAGAGASAVARPSAGAPPPGQHRFSAGPRHRLQRDLPWLLALKFAALGLLWLLFFSAAQRPAVDAAAASRQLAVEAPGD